MTGCTAEIDKTAFSEEDDVTTILHEVAIDLRFDVGDGLGVGFHPGNVDFNIKMANVLKQMISTESL